LVPRARSIAISQHSKNLLEAFRTSSSAPKPVEPAPPPAPVAKSASPFAPRAKSERRSSFGANPIVRLVLVQIALVGAAFWLGRWSVGAFGKSTAAHAQEPDASLQRALQPSAPAPSATQAPQVVDRTGLEARPSHPTAADTALLDPQNKYTIKMVEYTNNDASLELAKRVYVHLRDKGYPVCQPYVSGKSIHVMVGAAPRTPDLEKFLHDLKLLPGPGGKAGEFDSAYIVPIDRIVKRNN
jgi:hypothetical protein